MIAATVPNNALVVIYLASSVCFIVALKALQLPAAGPLGQPGWSRRAW